MKKQWPITLSVLLGILALWYIFANISVLEVFETFLHAKPWAVVAYLFSITTIMITLTWRWQVIIHSQDHAHIPLWHLFWYKTVGYAVSYVTPTAKVGGEPVRAGLLKRHGISFNDALSTVVIDKTIELTSSGIFFIIGAVIILFNFALPENTRWLMIVLSILFFAAIFHFYYQMLNGKDWFGKVFRMLQLHRGKKGKKRMKRLNEFEDLVIKFYHEDKKYFLATTMISALSWVLMFIEYKTALIILGYPNTNLMQCFLIFSFVGAAFLIPVPMALGSLEASQISVFAIIGMSRAAGVALALITRAKDLLWTILGFIALSIYGVRLSDAVKRSRSLSKEVGQLKRQ